MNKNFLNLKNPIRLFYFVSSAIFFAELGIMLFFQHFVISPSLIINLIDSSLLILILYPVLYFFVFKPLVLQNIELKLSKTDIEVKQAKYEAILTSIGEGMIVVDKDRKIIFFNKFAEEMMGWVNSSYVGKDFFEVIKMEDEEGNLISLDQHPINIVIHNKKNMNIISNYYIFNSKRERFPSLVSTTPVIYNKEIIGVIFMLRDITKEKEIEKNKSEFISFASHQLKTPPTAIKLLTERLLGEKVGELTEKQKEYFNDIRSSNQKMIDLVNLFLNVSRIELGSFAVQINQNNICNIIDSIIIELEPIALKKELKIKFISSVKNIDLLVDEPLFKIVISNLIVNSINYTKKGGKIDVECNIVNKGQKFSGRVFGENSLCITISDNGYGIPKNAQDKIFNKFFRADNIKESKVDGTGLGLYIVKSILDHSGGSIWFTSNENKGSEFYVSIPMSGMKNKISENKLIN